MFSPVLDKSVGLGYVSLEYSKVGTPISIMIRNKPVPAVVAPFPFIKKK
jgi:aminomethyltransferase